MQYLYQGNYFSSFQALAEHIDYQLTMQACIDGGDL